MTLQIDDAGVGDLLHGVVIGAYRPTTGEFTYEIVDVEFFQQPKFGRKAYLEETSRIVMKIIDKVKVTVTKITGEAQRFVETAYLDEVRNLGYEPLPEREEKRARNFFDMLRWLKKDPRRFKHAKTGWPRLKRYMKPGDAQRVSLGQPYRRTVSCRRH
jgi:hypothetical protein